MNRSDLFVARHLDKAQHKSPAPSIASPLVFSHQSPPSHPNCCQCVHDKICPEQFVTYGRSPPAPAGVNLTQPGAVQSFLVENKKGISGFSSKHSPDSSSVERLLSPSFRGQTAYFKVLLNLVGKSLDKRKDAVAY